MSDAEGTALLVLENFHRFLQSAEIVQALVDVPICIDSSVPAALKVGLETVRGRPLVNSVTGEEERLEAILPLVAKYNVPVVAISSAFSTPATRGSRCVPPAPGSRPSFTSGTPNFADGTATLSPVRVKAASTGSGPGRSSGWSAQARPQANAKVSGCRKTVRRALAGAR